MFDFVNTADYNKYNLKKIYRFNQFLIYKNYNINSKDYLSYCKTYFKSYLLCECIEYYNSYQLQMQSKNNINYILDLETNNNFKFNYNII